MWISQDTIRRIIQKKVDRHGLRGWCRKYDLSPAEVSRALRGLIPIGPKIARAVGYVKEPRYHRMDKWRD